MGNIDEIVAKLKQQKKAEEKNKINEKTCEVKKTEDKKAILKKVIEEIKDGDVNLNGKKFKFKKQLFLGGKIEFPIPMAYFEERVNDSNTLVLVNDPLGISLTFSYVGKGAIEQSFDEFKAGMEKGFKDMELSLEWLESGECGKGNSKISYGTYKTPTGKGDMYNAIIYRERKGTLIVGNYNCFYKDLKVWEYLIKGSIMSMKVNQ